MRRVLVAAALATLCATTVAVTACGSASEESPDASRSGTATATAMATTGADGAAADGADANTKQICADAVKVLTDSTEKFSKELTKLATSGANAGQETKDAMVSTFTAVFADWSAGLRELVGKATSAELKAALSDLADQVEDVGAKIRSFADLERVDTLLDAPGLDAASGKLKSFCS